MKTVNTKTNPNQTRVFDVVDNQLVTRWVDPKPAKQPNPRPLYNLLQALLGPQAILYAGEKKILVDAWNSGAITDTMLDELGSKLPTTVDHDAVIRRLIDTIEKYDDEFKVKPAQPVKRIPTEMELQLPCGHIIRRYGETVKYLERLFQLHPDSKNVNCPIGGEECEKKVPRELIVRSEKK